MYGEKATEEKDARFNGRAKKEGRVKFNLD